MKVTIYAPEGPSLFVLTPECMQPSADCQRRLGPLYQRGTLAIPHALLAAISHHESSFAGEFESLVDDEVSMRHLEALLRAVCETEHVARVLITSNKVTQRD